MPGGLQLVGLRRTFGDVVALDGLGFTVAPGTLFGFVGRNGAGKTTTMRIVCGLLAADDGSVTWRGELCDLLTDVLREQAARGVPVLFSSHQLELVEHLCESVAIIDRGRLVACGAVDELRAGGPRMIRVQVSDAAGDWTADLPGVEVVERAADGVLLELAPDTDSQQVLDAARRSGRVTRFAEVHPTLAELFRDLVAA